MRQPPMGEKDDYDSENSWISDGLPNSSIVVPCVVCFVADMDRHPKTQK